MGIPRHTISFKINIFIQINSGFLEVYLNTIQYTNNEINLSKIKDFTNQHYLNIKTNIC